MSSKLPAIISSTNLQKLAESVSYLAGKRAKLSKFHDVEDFVTSEPEPKDLLHHFGVLKTALVKTLWPEQCFIGSSILDDLLFSALCDPNVTDPLMGVLAAIKRAGVHEPGMIVYPLHSFGILGFGFLQYLENADTYLDLPEAGICITTQTNSLSGTMQFLEHARQLFGIDQSVSSDSIRHHHRVSLEWLERNQLLAVKASTFSGYAYENQPLLTIKLEIATALIFMLSVLEPARDEEVLMGSSSSRTNNWQTLDINHYLVLERSPNPGTELRARRVPMNIKRTELINLCDLQVDIDPAHWDSKPPILGLLIASLETVEKGYTRLSVSGMDNSVEARVYRKLFDALGFFRRSFHSQAEKGESFIFLATAFEMLLTDSFAAGVKPRLVRRYGLASAFEPAVAALGQSVGSLYERRSETVHQGKVDGKLDLRAAQKAFVYAFIGVVDALSKLPTTSPEPIAEILGDRASPTYFRKVLDFLKRLFG